MAVVDVVVVSYNSGANLRECVEPLATLPDANVVVVDNASADDSLRVVSDLSIQSIGLDYNAGFAHGCNVGARAGTAPYVLFLNPDAAIEPASLRRLVSELEEHPGVGAVAPRIVDRDGRIHHSQRRFPRTRRTLARALFLHRVVPHAGWVDEVIRDPAAYASPASPDWVSGACLLVRRTVLEELGGWDEGYFLYCEDIDLCGRVQQAGFELRFEPTAVAAHEGGASAPRTALLPVLAASRLRYAYRHSGRWQARGERAALALEALTHLVAARGGLAARVGHLRALRHLLRPYAGKPS